MREKEEAIKIDFQRNIKYIFLLSRNDFYFMLKAFFVSHSNSSKKK